MRLVETCRKLTASPRFDAAMLCVIAPGAVVPGAEDRIDEVRAAFDALPDELKLRQRTG